MDIVVVIRLMPGLADELEVNGDGTDIERDGGTVINEFDDQALEEAVLLKEVTAANITALGLQAEGMIQALRVSVARGADRAVVVETSAIGPYDSRGAATALAGAIQQLGADLVLTGVQTPYDVFGQTAPYLAAALGWPHASVISGVTLMDGRARVLQEYGAGRAASLELRLPAVLGVQSATSPPRYLSIGRLRQAMTTAADTIVVDGARPAPRSELLGLARPERREGATIFTDAPKTVAAQIFAVLREHGVVSG